MTEPNRLCATEAAALIAAGELSSEALVGACLARIAQRQPEVRAWKHLEPAAALAQARAADAAAPAGPLHGVAIAVKDIMDTAEMPTGYGSALYEGHRPAWDASAVALVREAGAVVLGKTVTSEFAGFHAGETRNPHDTTRTTGISSMGSAAAVADFMAPLAFGSQTGASIAKPAGYCGVIGYKPSFGSYDLTGVHPLAPSTDTLGHFARSIDDIGLLAAVLGGRPGIGAGLPARPPRIGFCPTAAWDSADRDVKHAVLAARDRLAAAGAAVEEVALPADFACLNDAVLTIIRYEAARTAAHEYRTGRARLGAGTVTVIEAGRAIAYEDYGAARALAASCRARLAALFAPVDVLLTPGAEQEAPLLDEPIGDSRFIRFWTLLHVPTVSLPTATGRHGLPLGIQLIGPPGGDDGLLRACRWVERALAEGAEGEAQDGPRSSGVVPGRDRGLPARPEN